jgi:hypothetical protein
MSARLLDFIRERVSPAQAGSKSKMVATLTQRFRAGLKKLHPACGGVRGHTCNGVPYLSLLQHQREQCDASVDGPQQRRP